MTSPNKLNPTLYRNFTNSIYDSALYTNATMLEVHYDQLLETSEADPNKYKAIVMSGFRTEMNTGVGNDWSDGSLVTAIDGQKYLEISVYPIHAGYGLIIPNPINARNLGELYSIINVCTDLCRVRSSYPIDGNQKSLSFGQVIDVFKEENLYYAEGAYNGMRFDTPEGVPHRIPSFDELWVKDYLKVGNTTLGAFDNAVEIDLMEDLPDWRDNEEFEEDRLDTLDARLKPLVAEIIAAMERRGFRPVLWSAHRSLEEQYELYKAGHSGVTFSFHNAYRDGKPAALAADIIDKEFLGSGKTYDGHSYDYGGKWADLHSPKRKPFWDALGEEAKSRGLIWGADFYNATTGTGLYDPAHVQLLPNSALTGIKRATKAELKRMAAAEATK